jgi:1-phosphofructokinase family hexose kinase
MEPPFYITLTLNPAIDRTAEVDQLSPGKHLTVHTTNRSAGGKGINVARILAREKCSCVATGLLGKENASIFESTFAREGIVDRCVRIDGCVRENFTLLDLATGQDTHFREAGPVCDAAELEQIDAVLKDVSRPGCVVSFCGSAPRGLSPEAVGETIGRARRPGVRVVADMEGALLAAAVKQSGLWMIAPNVNELAELAGHTLDDPGQQIAAARSLIPKTTYVLLSRGSDGASLISADHAWHARATLPPSVSVCNTVGCGDVLLATFLAKLSPDHDNDPPMGDEQLAGALKHAVAAATASAADPIPAQYDATLRGVIYETTVAF